MAVTVITKLDNAVAVVAVVVVGLVDFVVVVYGVGTFYSLSGESQ